MHKAGKMMFPSLKGLARSAIIKLQSELKLYPRGFCLISGAPRSGTSVLGEWLHHQPGVSEFHESRILVSTHRFMEEMYRFKNLDKDSVEIIKLARRLVLNYYSSSRILIRERLLIDKEPLEPIAFPLKDYSQFLINVRRLFPESKLLLIIRDPIATIWSMTRRTWGESLTNMETKRFTLEEHIENWCSCVDLILRYRTDPNTYILQFERLITDKENESKKLLNFLKIQKGETFQPRQTKDIGFSDGERKEIIRMAQTQLELLNAQGISYLK
jgi:hypothetical protein